MNSFNLFNFKFVASSHESIKLSDCGWVVHSDDALRGVLFMVERPVYSWLDHSSVPALQRVQLLAAVAQGRKDPPGESKGSLPN